MPKHWSCSINFRDRRWLMINKDARLTIWRFATCEKKNDPFNRFIRISIYRICSLSIVLLSFLLFVYDVYRSVRSICLKQIRKFVRCATSRCIAHCILFDQIKIEYMKHVVSSSRASIIFKQHFQHTRSCTVSIKFIRNNNRYFFNFF